MYETIIQHLPELLSALLASGGVAAIFTIPERKRSKKAEAEREELTNAKMLIEQWAPLLKSIKEENEALRKEVEELRQKVSKQSATIADLKTRQHTMELIAKEHKALRCEITSCPNRQPPLDKGALENIADIK